MICAAYLHIQTGFDLTAKARFTQADVQRLVKGIRLGGATIGRLEVEPSGKLVAYFSAQKGEESALADPATWGGWSDDDI